MTQFEIRTIKNDEDHAWALDQIDLFWDSQEGTPEFEYLMVLSDLTARYEESRYPVEEPDPIDMIRFYMEQNGLDQAALATLLKSRSRASEILGRKKPLSITHIRALHDRWHIPADILIQKPRLAVEG
ncbi:MAG TPA: transcriptional regulator [Rhodospirillaceae bacterium]|jgi:HTH-type transcriptional regulator/antitoxin HigA|nr:transcriptional regulator [Rhodospirillaceae bacterium]MAX61884.1 transcriptional regulator [Rhodospirillaceae bacterium]HBM13097.1 transcriptional regulator [Rhodospirillaceae bacterium]|tara:strand:- start:94706 stop:95089 length:384 start_codon:yes stop_codon:yes gene_type:complete